MTTPNDPNKPNEPKDLRGFDPAGNPVENDQGLAHDRHLDGQFADRGSARDNVTGADHGAPQGGHYADHTNQPPIGEGYAGYAGGEYSNATGEKSKLALATLIVGAVSLVSMFIPFLGIIAIPGGIAAIVMAIVAFVRNRKRPAEERRTWMSVVGLILGLIILGLVIFGAVAAVSLLQSPEVKECMNKESQEAIQQCMEQIGDKAKAENA